MKTLMLTALVLTVGIAAAEDKKPDPVGTWKCEYSIGDQKRTATLEVKKDGDGYAGTMSWPDQKDVKLKDVKFKDGVLTYSAVRVFMDNKIPIDFKLTFKGDTFEGKAEAEFGGNKSAYDMTGKRETKDK